MLFQHVFVLSILVVLQAHSEDRLSKATENHAAVISRGLRQHSGQPWPDRTIPYVIDSSLRGEQELIRKAMDDVTTGTCVRFATRTNQLDYVLIKQGRPCQAPVGKSGGQQVFILSTECVSNTAVLRHELMHVVGFFHEHSRPDRDDYATIHLDNVRTSDFNQYAKFRPLLKITDFKYDFNSIMHYTSRHRSKNGRPTITAKDGRWKFGSTGVLTDLDTAKIRKLYQCDQANFEPNNCFDHNDICGDASKSRPVKSSSRCSRRVRRMCPKTCGSCQGAP